MVSSVKQEKILAPIGKFESRASGPGPPPVSPPPPVAGGSSYPTRKRIFIWSVIFCFEQSGNQTGAVSLRNNISNEKMKKPYNSFFFKKKKKIVFFFFLKKMSTPFLGRKEGGGRQKNVQWSTNSKK